MWWLKSLTQFGGLLCLTVVLVIMVGVGVWVYYGRFLEPLMKGMGVSLMMGSCFLSLAAVFAFIGFLLDVILNTEGVFNLAGAGVGALIGLWLGMLLSSRSSL